MKYLFLFLALFLSLSLLLWNVSATISKGYREREKFERIFTEVSEKETEVERLKRELAFAQSEEAAEQGVRDVLGMSYPGEDVVFVDESALLEPKDKSAEGLSSENLADISKEQSNLTAWLRLFFY